MLYIYSHSASQSLSLPPPHLHLILVTHPSSHLLDNHHRQQLDSGGVLSYFLPLLEPVKFI